MTKVVTGGEKVKVLCNSFYLLKTTPKIKINFTTSKFGSKIEFFSHPPV